MRVPPEFRAITRFRAGYDFICVTLDLSRRVRSQVLIYVPVSESGFDRKSEIVNRKSLCGFHVRLAPDNGLGFTQHD